MAFAARRRGTPATLYARQVAIRHSYWEPRQAMTDTEIRVRDWMSTEVVSLMADEHLNFANDLMRLARIRHMPVLSKGRLVGIVSQRDLFRAAISSALRLRPV